MFSGIVETMGQVQSIDRKGKNCHLQLAASFANVLKAGQSIAHNGICLTVTSAAAQGYQVTAVDETWQRTSLHTWQPGDWVNLERALPAYGRFEGHIVQGHIDQVGQCIAIEEKMGNWLFQFKYNPSQGHCLVEKGSIAINGVSLTCFNITENTFTVAIVPYTWQHTNFQYLRPHDGVNLEFDLLGKYIQKYLTCKV